MPYIGEQNLVHVSLLDRPANAIMNQMKFFSSNSLSYSEWKKNLMKIFKS